MFRRMMPRVASVLLSLTLLFCSAGNALALTQKTLNVPLIKQAKDQWCWAASAEMAGSYLYPYIQRNQCAVVRFLCGTSSNPYPNKPAPIWRSADALRYTTDGHYTVDYVTSSWSFGALTASVDANQPVMASAGYYNSAGQRQGGHMVVICGYVYDPNPPYGSIIQNILYNDPWINNNIRVQCSYAGFCDGSVNGRRYDGTVYVV